MSLSIPFSILDLAHVPQGSTVRQAILKSQAIARCAEANGYHRHWLAEHHGMRGVASAATAVMLAAIGQVTERIRIGAGGIMLPNHAPLVIAEQFGTLEAMFPGRVDLGLGRAPGTDMTTARALRRDIHGDAERYPQDVAELQHFLAPAQDDAKVIAVPGNGSNVPLWLLGSSMYSAQLAAHMGLPFAFASHFAPDYLYDAIHLYKNQFKPSAQLAEPYVAAGVMAVVADQQEEADYLATSLQQQFANLRRGANRPLPEPVEDIYSVLSDMEVQAIAQTLRYALIGTPDSARAKLSEFVEQTGVDEVIFSFPIYDQTACLGAIERVAALRI